MSLDIWLKEDLYDKHGRLIDDHVVFETNVTHNLNKMAQEADLYLVMWRPEELDIKVARDAIRPLLAGIQTLVDRQDEMVQYVPDNGWGSYDNLLDAALDYMVACIRHPETIVGISR